jgi:hypothetical protein
LSILAERPDFFTKLVSQINNKYTRNRHATLDIRGDLWHLLTLALGEDLRLQDPGIARPLQEQRGERPGALRGENKTHCKRSR